MLTLLIPIFNFDVRKLVFELHSQALKASIPFEIILLDDNSTVDFKQKNRVLAELAHVIYEELPQNIGRSKIRNLLFSKAQFEYCLVMDCDAKIYSSSFLSEYIKRCRGKVVVCGGILYESECLDASKYLRLHYGLQRESRTVSERNRNPYHSFSTFNFLLAKNIIKDIHFDETISNYGHEDTMFGLALQNEHITVIHIDNPLIHIGIEQNEIFLNKALQGVRNLHSLLQNQNGPIYLNRHITLLNYHKKISNLGIKPVFHFLYTVFHSSLEKRLIRNGKNLFYFDILRLGYLCKIS